MGPGAGRPGPASRPAGQGAEIARVDPTQAEAALQAAEAQASGAEAPDPALSAQARVSVQLAQGVATRSDLDAADQQLLRARSARDQALTQVAKARRAVEDTVLRAQSDVIASPARPNPARSSAPADRRTLAADARRVAVFYAPDSVDLSAFLGEKVALTTLEGDLTLQAKISEVSPVVDAATGTVRVKAGVRDRPPTSRFWGRRSWVTCGWSSPPWSTCRGGR